MIANSLMSAEGAGISWPACHIHFHRKEALLIPKPNPIRVIVYYPQTDEGKRALARRMAGVHADWVCDKMKKLNCPAEQKTQLFNAVMAAAKRKRDQAR